MNLDWVSGAFRNTAVQWIASEGILNNIGDTVVEYIPRVLQALLILAAGHVLIKMVVRLIGKGLKKSRLDNALHSVIKQTLKISMQVLVIFSAVSALGIVEKGSFITILGTVGLAVSLAVKDSVADVASGLILLVNRRFGPGDYVDINANSGHVVKITLTYVQLNTLDNKEIFIPNSAVAKATVTNYSLTPSRMLEISLTLEKKAEAEQARGVILEVLRKNTWVLIEPEPMVVLSAFTAASATLLIRAWTHQEHFFDLGYVLNEEISRAFDKAGLNRKD